ncbi:MAG: glutathione S-transferase family protein [Panacagrimonas sp.]
MNPVLRIFSYLPNPRIAKATIVARLCGIEVEVRGAPAQDLGGWLWDYEAHPMDAAERASLAHLVVAPKTGFKASLYKTPAFLAAHPFGTVPAAFGPGGEIGIFESNSIMRAVARAGAQAQPGLYGHGDPWLASRIDAFLDASLLFARDTQVYVLALRDAQLSPATHAQMASALITWLTGLERALGTRAGDSAFIAGDTLTLADIAFVCELALLQNERNHHDKLARLELQPVLEAHGGAEAFPRANAHYTRLLAHPAIAPDLQPYVDAPPLR